MRFVPARVGNFKLGENLLAETCTLLGCDSFRLVLKFTKILGENLLDLYAFRLRFVPARVGKFELGENLLTCTLFSCDSFRLGSKFTKILGETFSYLYAILSGSVLAILNSEIIC